MKILCEYNANFDRRRQMPSKKFLEGRYEQRPTLFERK